MPRITAEREEATRRRILKAAKALFVEKGFARASIDDVVAASGMSVGAIYNYFPNKDELIRAAIDTANREETDALLADTRSVGPVVDRLERSFRGWWESTIDAPGGTSFLTEAWAESSRRPLIRELMGRRFERSVMFCTLLLRESVEHGELPPDVDIDTLAHAFACMLEGIVVEYVETGGSLRRVDAQKRFRLVMDALMTGGRA